jgi:hypothetical protein
MIGSRAATVPYGSFRLPVLDRLRSGSFPQPLQTLLSHTTTPRDPGPTPMIGPSIPRSVLIAAALQPVHASTQRSPRPNPHSG